MATYSTDLTTRDTADAATNWVELTGTIGGFTLSGAGTPAADGENYIQGVDCVSQTTGKAVDAEISIAYDHGTNLTFTTGHVVFAWCFYAVGVNLKTKANDGWMYAICDSTTTGNYYSFGGSDSGRNPYGGWTNVAIDPTATATGTLGAGGNSGNYRYFGHVCNTLAEISKGTPSAVDAIRTGRGEISITGSGGSFSELASYNDWNSTATPPGTSSTVKDSGYHRFGLFQEAGGTYLWKGLLSLGLTGTSVTFSDSNETIIIDDCPFTYAAFNKVEINNASSSVTLNNITFISTATTTNGTGYFEVVDDATVSLTGCSFNKMGNFTFLTNGTISGTTWNTCGQIVPGGSTFTGCTFNTSSATSAVVAASPAHAALISNSTYNSDGTGHGLEITGTAANITLTNCTWNDYAATDGSTGNEAVYVNIATGSMNLTISGGTTPSVRTAGCSVTVISGAVSVTVKTVTESGTAISGARVHLEADTGGPFPVGATVTIANSGTTATVTHTAHGLATNDKVVIRGASHNQNNGVFSITVTGTNTYTYTMASAPGSSPTGTITSTFVVLNGTTDVNGEITMSRVFPSNQPANGRARKSSSSPYFKNSNLSGTVNSSTGAYLTAVMISDD